MNVIHQLILFGAQSLAVLWTPKSPPHLASSGDRSGRTGRLVAYSPEGNTVLIKLGREEISQASGCRPRLRHGAGVRAQRVHVGVPPLHVHHATASSSRSFHEMLSDILHHNYKNVKP